MGVGVKMWVGVGVWVWEWVGVGVGVEWVWGGCVRGRGWEQSRWRAATAQPWTAELLLPES